MKYSTADQRYLMWLIIWTVPPMKQKDNTFIGRHNGTHCHLLAALCFRRIALCWWPFSFYFLTSWNRTFRKKLPHVQRAVEWPSVALKSVSLTLKFDAAIQETGYQCEFAHYFVHSYTSYMCHFSYSKGSPTYYMYLS